MNPAPVITIIVSILNAAADLAESLDSFSSQTFPDFEVVIADCNSTDDPAQHCAGRNYRVRHVVQSDTGIYDAWNKVIPLARGEWLIFMGAGDVFHAADTLETAAALLADLPADVLMAYGRVNVAGENGDIVGRSGATWREALEDVQNFEMFPHQATFQRRRTFAEFGLFDASYRIAGDTDMIFRLANVKAPVFFPLTVATFRYGGTSSLPSRRLESIREMVRLMKHHGVRAKSNFAIIKAVVLNFLAQRLPRALLLRLIDLYRNLTARASRYH